MGLDYIYRLIIKLVRLMDKKIYKESMEEAKSSVKKKFEDNLDMRIRISKATLFFLEQEELFMELGLRDYTDFCRKIMEQELQTLVNEGQYLDDMYQLFILDKK